MNNNNILFIKNKENILFSIKNNNILFSSKQRMLLMDNDNVLFADKKVFCLKTMLIFCLLKRMAISFTNNNIRTMFCLLIVNNGINNHIFCRY